MWSSGARCAVDSRGVECPLHALRRNGCCPSAAHSNAASATDGSRPQSQLQSQAESESDSMRLQLVAWGGGGVALPSARTTTSPPNDGVAHDAYAGLQWKPATWYSQSSLQAQHLLQAQAKLRSLSDLLSHPRPLSDSTANTESLTLTWEREQLKHKQQQDISANVALVTPTASESVGSTRRLFVFADNTQAAANAESSTTTAAASDVKETSGPATYLPVRSGGPRRSTRTSPPTTPRSSTSASSNGGTRAAATAAADTKPKAASEVTSNNSEFGSPSRGDCRSDLGCCRDYESCLSRCLAQMHAPTLAHAVSSSRETDAENFDWTKYLAYASVSSSNTSFPGASAMHRRLRSFRGDWWHPLSTVSATTLSISNTNRDGVAAASVLAQYLHRVASAHGPYALDWGRQASAAAAARAHAPGVAAAARRALQARVGAAAALFGGAANTTAALDDNSDAFTVAARLLLQSSANASDDKGDTVKDDAAVALAVATAEAGLFTGPTLADISARSRGRLGDGNNHNDDDDGNNGSRSGATNTVNAGTQESAAAAVFVVCSMRCRASSRSLRAGNKALHLATHCYTPTPMLALAARVTEDTFPPITTSHNKKNTNDTNRVARAHQRLSPLSSLMLDSVSRLLPLRDVDERALVAAVATLPATARKHVQATESVTAVDSHAGDVSVTSAAMNRNTVSVAGVAEAGLALNNNASDALRRAIPEAKTQDSVFNERTITRSFQIAHTNQASIHTRTRPRLKARSRDASPLFTAAVFVELSQSITNSQSRV